MLLPSSGWKVSRTRIQSEVRKVNKMEFVRLFDIPGSFYETDGITFQNVVLFMITDATTSHLSFNSIVNTSLNYLTVCSR
jgi:hypothetical protein